MVSHWSVNYREAFFLIRPQIIFKLIAEQFLITSCISDPTPLELSSFLIYSGSTSGVAYSEVLVNEFKYFLAGHILRYPGKVVL